MKKSQLEIITFLYHEEQRLWKVFMDKSLSEGCYVTWYNWCGSDFTIIVNEENIYNKNTITVYDENDTNWFIECKEWSELDIIGHYWLDSILKYIDECNFWSIRITEYEIVTSLWDKNACIPNKSPNLYTDEENKSLLKLLKQLWENTQ